ncbi:DUF975 family protein [Lactobacillus terrae]|uniref:DUF975 family protein n=1 Tax=Lactobacillus terrae TaxID=2269374 RepID=UPI000C1B7773|nr:DUF975 family protein [Lactobacillus terrae]
MINVNKISLREVRRATHKEFRSNLVENISLNFIPILLRFLGLYFILKIYYAWMNNLNISTTDPPAATARMEHILTDISNNPDSVNNYTIKLDNLSTTVMYLLFLILCLISVGIGYSLVNKFRNSELHLSPMAAFSVFSTKYFFGTIILLIMNIIIFQIGLWLFIIPGVILMLIYSQNMYIYKDDVDAGQGRIFATYRKSAILMRGNKGAFFVLLLEFLILEIINFFTYEILSIWLHPFEQLTFAKFYQTLVDNQ